MARAKLDSKMKTEQANQLKALEQAGAEKRMEVKRKLQEVRKVLLVCLSVRCLYRQSCDLHRRTHLMSSIFS